MTAAEWAARQCVDRERGSALAFGGRRIARRPGPAAGDGASRTKARRPGVLMRSEPSGAGRATSSARGSRPSTRSWPGPRPRGGCPGARRRPPQGPMPPAGPPGPAAEPDQGAAPAAPVVEAGQAGVPTNRPGPSSARTTWWAGPAPAGWGSCPRPARCRASAILRPGAADPPGAGRRTPRRRGTAEGVVVRAPLPGSPKARRSPRPWLRVAASGRPRPVRQSREGQARIGAGLPP